MTAHQRFPDVSWRRRASGHSGARRPSAVHAPLPSPPPPPPNTIKTANEGRFRLNVDSPYGERAQSTALTRAPPRRPARQCRDFIFNLSMRESSFAFTMPEEEGAFDSVSAHLLATAANIFGWAGDPTK